MLDSLQILTLLTTPGVGPATVRHLLDAFPDANPDTVDEMHDLLAALREERPRSPLPALTDLEAGRSGALMLLDRAVEEGIMALGRADHRFPTSLRSIANAPVVLYIKGDPATFVNTPAIAIVGTREPTSYGLASASRIASFFAEQGATIVSGLAVGCDTAAHEGCLVVQGRTVAVLAHGLDMIYPAQNRGLAERIVAAGGCLVSEYPPGAAPQKQAFVERDRLQSGLSQAVIIIETDIKGGTMHTARFCLEQGRLLGCVDHPPKLMAEPKVQGNQLLIKEGKAMPLGDRSALETFLARLATSASPSIDTAQLPLF